MSTNFSSLTALSSLDGRYHNKLEPLRPIFSEFGLIKYRVIVEIRWLIALAEHSEIQEVSALTTEQQQYLENIMRQFSEADAAAIKKIEESTNHDVKAVEYFIRDKIESRNDLQHLSPFIHFACTSEDINNLAYALMLKEARETVVSPCMDKLIKKIEQLAEQNRALAMLARTHGQSATPTTLGKELINFAYRFKHQLIMFNETTILGKFNGAVGNFNAHICSYPDVDWMDLNQTFVSQLGLTWNPYTTQIEPHDFIAEMMHALMRFNTILIDFNRDIWSYISIGYFAQQKVEHEVGSSTMPHKVNPIDFENSEGNLGLANAIADHLAAKLPVSRWQRDLTDSTVLRNIGQAIGFSYLSYLSTLKGLSKLAANPDCIAADLNKHWEVLAEAIQTCMRRYGIKDAYEQLKAFTRGKTIDATIIQAFIDRIDLPEQEKKRLKEMTPESYTGSAVKLVEKYFE